MYENLPIFRAHQCFYDWLLGMLILSPDHYFFLWLFGSNVRKVRKYKWTYIKENYTFHIIFIHCSYMGIKIGILCIIIFMGIFIQLFSAYTFSLKMQFVMKEFVWCLNIIRIDFICYLKSIFLKCAKNTFLFENLNFIHCLGTENYIQYMLC